MFPHIYIVSAQYRWREASSIGSANGAGYYKNKTPKKEPKEEKGTTNDSVKFQQIQKVPTMPYLPTIMESNNRTYMITEGVCNKFFKPPRGDKKQCQANDDKEAL
ncbi:hypothetical protein PIB30_100343, partial [Stylosanthes scabra]|nr:hypothetical protein [Stylosanthes scabra]